MSKPSTLDSQTLHQTQTKNSPKHPPEPLNPQPEKVCSIPGTFTSRDATVCSGLGFRVQGSGFRV